MHAASLENNLISTAFRTIVWLQLGQDWIVVVPVVDQIATLLLLVERHAESDWLVRIVGEGRLADQIGRALEGGLD